MGNASNLKYGDKVNYYEGVIVEVQDNSIAIDVLGRLGYFVIPKDFVIAKDSLIVGQTVGWKMSFFEQLPEDITKEFTPGVENPDKTVYLEGIVSYVEDCAVALIAKDNMGEFKSPKRMLISDNEFEAGQTVGWNTSMFVQLGPEVNEKYVSNLQTRERRAIEISSRNN